MILPPFLQTGILGCDLFAKGMDRLFGRGQIGGHNGQFGFGFRQLRNGGEIGFRAGEKTQGALDEFRHGYLHGATFVYLFVCVKCASIVALRGKIPSTNPFVKAESPLNTWPCMAASGIARLADTNDLKPLAISSTRIWRSSRCSSLNEVPGNPMPLEGPLRMGSTFI